MVLKKKCTAVLKKEICTAVLKKENCTTVLKKDAVHQDAARRGLLRPEGSGGEVRGLRGNAERGAGRGMGRRRRRSGFIQS